MSYPVSVKSRTVVGTLTAVFHTVDVPRGGWKDKEKAQELGCKKLRPWGFLSPNGKHKEAGGEGKGERGRSKRAPMAAECLLYTG